MKVSKAQYLEVINSPEYFPYLKHMASGLIVVRLDLMRRDHYLPINGCLVKGFLFDCKLRLQGTLIVPLEVEDS